VTLISALCSCGPQKARKHEPIAHDFNPIPTIVAVDESNRDPIEESLSATPTHVLFMMQQGHLTEAIQHYRTYVARTGAHDFVLLRQLSTLLLEHGYQQPDMEDQIMTMFGAGVAGDPQLLPILRSALNSHHPQVQMIAVDLLAQMKNDAADDLLNRAMSSPYLSTRFEAGFQLATKRLPTAASQLEALMAKVPSELRPLFPQLFTMVGNHQSDAILRQLLADTQPLVQRATILSVSHADRDDLLPQIRKLSLQLDPLQQEACAFALGRLLDSSSLSRLQELSNSPSINVQIAALSALYSLGQQEAALKMQQLAQQNHLHAIVALAEMPGSENVLAALLHSSEIGVRVNATMALLHLRDPRATEGLEEILIRDSRDLAFHPHFSVGGAQMCWRVVPSATHNFNDDSYALEISTHMRELALSEAINLPEEYFLKTAALIFHHKQNDLVPMLVHLLENLQTPAAISMLQEQQLHAGAPLIRDYCNLILYRLKQPGPYEDNLRRWVRAQRHTDLIRLRPMLPWDQRPSRDSSSYQLTPEETSRLLVESFETLAQRQDASAVNALLNAIEKGNPHNRYALAGLLIKATE
jgi:HEAT repeat protein